MLLLSCRSGQGKTFTLYTDAMIEDHRLVSDTTSRYQTTHGATEILTPLVAILTPSLQGILYIILPVHFMQEAPTSLPLMLKYSMNQPLRTNKQCTMLPVNRLTLEIFKV